MEQLSGGHVGAGAREVELAAVASVGEAEGAGEADVPGGVEEREVVGDGEGGGAEVEVGERRRALDRVEDQEAGGAGERLGLTPEREGGGSVDGARVGDAAVEQAGAHGPGAASDREGHVEVGVAARVGTGGRTGSVGDAGDEGVLEGGGVGCGGRVGEGARREEGLDTVTEGGRRGRRRAAVAGDELPADGALAELAPGGAGVGGR